jgi:hypothetical protein
MRDESSSSSFPCLCLCYRLCATLSLFIRLVVLLLKKREREETTEEPFSPFILPKRQNDGRLKSYNAG